MNNTRLVLKLFRIGRIGEIFFVSVTNILLSFTKDFVVRKKCIPNFKYAFDLLFRMRTNVVDKQRESSFPN